MKKCSRCGSNKTVLDVDDRGHWYRNKENGRLLCNLCYRKQLNRIRNPKLLERDKRSNDRHCSICKKPLCFGIIRYRLKDGNVRVKEYLRRKIVNGKSACDNCRNKYVYATDEDYRKRVIESSMRWQKNHLEYRIIYRILCRPRTNILQNTKRALKRGYWVGRLD